MTDTPKKPKSPKWIYKNGYAKLVSPKPNTIKDESLFKKSLQSAYEIGLALGKSTDEPNDIKWSSIKKIQLSLKTAAGIDVNSHFVTLNTGSHDLPPVHLEPTCFSLLWFLILHQEGSKRNDVSPFNYFKTDRWWSNINKIWKAVHGNTYYSHIHEVVDLKESITPMFAFIEKPEIIEKIEEGGVGSWVIDIRRKRRGNYLSKIKRIIKTEASIRKIPKDLFILDRPFKEFDSHWNSLYKLNDEYFSSIQLDTPNL